MINFSNYIKRKKAFVPFITAGDPDIESTKEFVKALIEAGSTIIEIGIPFSDPIAEGKTIMEADERALKKFEVDLDYHIVADYGPMFVDPNYVGNGLQYQMLTWLDGYCQDKGYQYAAGTVHPDNIFCIRNMLKDEFEYKNQKEFSRGLRNIYVKKY